jgi:acetyl-CoA carboxylase biotin carboxyl carrier protein
VLEIEKIRELVEMMVAHELTEVELRDGEQCVAIKRGAGAHAVPTVLVAPPPAAASGMPAGAPPPKADDGLLSVRSPMVGTFYAAPDPESPDYVSIGSVVEPDVVVGIIEAMKVFNEIKADVSGTIEQVLVRNEQPVEYGQPLFLVRPRA